MAWIRQDNMMGIQYLSCKGPPLRRLMALYGDLFDEEQRKL